MRSYSSDIWLLYRWNNFVPMPACNYLMSTLDVTCSLMYQALPLLSRSENKARITPYNALYLGTAEGNKVAAGMIFKPKECNVVCVYIHVPTIAITILYRWSGGRDKGRDFRNSWCHCWRRYATTTGLWHCSLDFNCPQTMQAMEHSGQNAIHVHMEKSICFICHGLKWRFIFNTNTHDVLLVYWSAQCLNPWLASSRLCVYVLIVGPYNYCISWSDAAATCFWCNHSLVSWPHGRGYEASCTTIWGQKNWLQ